MLLLGSCSGLSTLTPEMLDRAEAKWSAGKPASYRLVVSMEGDRVERGEFDVQVQNGVVTSLKRNGEVVNLKSGEDYSMDGLFKMVRTKWILPGILPCSVRPPATRRILWPASTTWEGFSTIAALWAASAIRSISRFSALKRSRDLENREELSHAAISGQISKVQRTRSCAWCSRFFTGATVRVGCLGGSRTVHRFL